MSGLEVETTLAIRSAFPERVAEAIAERRSLGGLALRHLPAVAMHDTYWDLAGEVLRCAGLGLRVRQIESRRLLTFKGPARLTDGAVVREELEQSWSPSTLAKVCARMEAFGVQLRTGLPDVATDPVRTLTRLGFHVLQQRETLRRRREVTEPRRPRSPLAELAIDAVAFRFDDRVVRHYEVEIEAKDRDRGSAPRRIAEVLMATWGSELRLWLYGKLATGRAIEALLRTSPHDTVVDDQGRLRPGAYDQLEERLTRA